MLSDEKRKQIALAIFKFKAIREEIPITKDLRRFLGDIAQSTGTPIEELMEFYWPYAQAQLNRIFKSGKVDAEEILQDSILKG